jgi:LysM repeat protein
MRRLSLPRIVLLLYAAFLLCAALPAFAQEATHVVQPGENLFRIALRYGLSTDDLAQANGISNAWQIYVDQVLVIPVAGQTSAPAVDPAASVVEPAIATSSTYTVARGDTLNSIAHAFNMTIEQLAQVNNLTNPNLVFTGQTLVVSAAALEPVETAPQPVEAAVVAPSTIDAQTIHTVMPGEYLSSIARQYGVSWLSIAEANNIYDTNTVIAGQQLIIPTAIDAVYIQAAPPALVGVGREIIVDISDSRVYAYENGVLVRNVLGSMGRLVTPTIVGSFAVQRKYVTTLMTGPGYYTPDVPWTMYFYSGYAIHGAYWHNNWGTPMSHGCVNLPVPEAEWFFYFADVGTPVNVQY